MSAEDMTSPESDQLSVMTYLTAYRKYYFTHFDEIDARIALREANRLKASNSGGYGI